MQDAINILCQKGYIDISSDDDTGDSTNILRKIADAIENNKKEPSKSIVKTPKTTEAKSTNSSKELSIWMSLRRIIQESTTPSKLWDKTPEQARVSMLFLPLKSSLQSLLKKGQIRMVERHRRHDEYKISKAAENALLNNKPFKAEKAVKIDRYKFCERISDFIEMRSNDEMETQDLFKLAEEEEENNSQLKFVKEVNKILSSVEDRTLFYEVCDDFVRDNRRRAATGLDCTLSDIYDSCRGRLNIAKSTGRSVYHVDIAASKTCWFGESEKLFKQIFTDYRKMCEKEEKKPILLFNEADALFSKRKDVNSGSCAQTENALQNILLEEMEALDGILIANSNGKRSTVCWMSWRKRGQKGSMPAKKKCN